MREFTVTFVFALALFLLCPVFLENANATPSVTVSTELREDSRYLIFTFIQNDLSSMDGCFYNLMAAPSANNLERKHISARSIATFYKPLPAVKIIAGPLRALSQHFGSSKRRKRRGLVFFKTLITCYNGEITRAETFSVSFTTHPRGTLQSINRLIKEMKYNMAYFEDV